MRIAIVLAATAALLAAADPARACRCLPPPPPLEELADSDAVFSGTVAAVELDETGLVRHIKFEVANCWKGGVGALVEIQTSASGASCGRGFVIGVEYLVYATGPGGALHVSLCDRTKRLEFAQEDLGALGEPHCTTPVLPNTWSGMKRIYE